MSSSGNLQPVLLNSFEAAGQALQQGHQEPECFQNRWVPYWQV